MVESTTAATGDLVAPSVADDAAWGAARKAMLIYPER